MKIRFGWNVLKIEWKKYVAVDGIRSSCDGGKHSLFLDFDDVPLGRIRSVVKLVQRLYDAGDAFIFKTSDEFKNGSWHVIFPAKFTLRECLNIWALVGCDRNFIAFNYRRGFAVLRISSKGKKGSPVFSHVMKSPTRRGISSSHCALLSLLTGDKIEGNDSGGLWIHRYVTFERHR